MTFEQGAIIVIGALTTALCFIAKILWERSNACEKDRYELRAAIEQAKEQSHGLGIFIRSLATRGHLGGLTRATRDVVAVLDASETVGDQDASLIGFVASRGRAMVIAAEARPAARRTSARRRASTSSIWKGLAT